MNEPASSGHRIDVHDHYRAAHPAADGDWRQHHPRVDPGDATARRHEDDERLYRPRRSRRRRDYLVGAVAGLVVFGVVALFVRRSPLFLTIVGSAAILYQIALAWIMWAIADDY